MNTFRRFSHGCTNSQARGFYSEIQCLQNSRHDTRSPVCKCLSEKDLLDGLRKAVDRLYTRSKKNNRVSCTKSEYFYDILSAVTSLDCEFKKLEHLFSTFKNQYATPSDAKTRLNHSVEDTVFLKLAAKSLLKFINNLKQELLTHISTAEGQNRKTICHTNQLISILEVNLNGLLKKLEEFKLQFMEKNTCSHLHSHSNPITKMYNRTTAGVTENEGSCSVNSPKTGSNKKSACYYCKKNNMDKVINLNPVTKSEAVLKRNQSSIVNVLPRNENDRLTFTQDYKHPDHRQHKKCCNNHAIPVNFKRKCRCEKEECNKGLYEVAKLEKIKYGHIPQTGNTNTVREQQINNNKLNKCTAHKRIVTSIKQRGCSVNQRKIRYSLPATLTQDRDKHHYCYSQIRRRKRAGKDTIAKRSRSKLNYNRERSRYYDRRKRHVNLPTANVKRKHGRRSNSSYSSSNSLMENNGQEMLHSTSSESSSDQNSIRETKHLNSTKKKNIHNSMEGFVKKGFHERYRSRNVKRKPSKYSINSSKSYKIKKIHKNSERQRNDRSVIIQIKRNKTFANKIKPQFPSRSTLRKPQRNLSTFSVYSRAHQLNGPNSNKGSRHKLYSFELLDSESNKENFICIRQKSKNKNDSPFGKRAFPQVKMLKVNKVKRFLTGERYSNLNLMHPTIPNKQLSHHLDKKRNCEPSTCNYYQYIECIPACEEIIPEVFYHNIVYECSSTCKCSHERQSHPEIELIPICNPNKNKTTTYNEGCYVNLRSRSSSVEEKLKPISHKHNLNLHKRKSIYTKSINRRISKSTNSGTLIQTHSPSDSSTSYSDISTLTKQSSSSYGEAALKKQLFYKNIHSHKGLRTINQAISKEERAPSYEYIYYKQKSQSSLQKNRKLRRVGEHELEYEMPQSEDQILMTTRTAQRKHKRSGKLKKAVNKQMFEDERLAFPEESPVAITYKRRKYRRRGNLNNVRSENVIEEYERPSTADDVHTASLRNFRNKRSRKYHKESREQMYEDILTSPFENVPALIVPPTPKHTPPTKQIPPSKDTYSIGTITDTLPLHAKRTSTTELVQLMRTIGTNTQPILANDRPKAAFSKGTETDVTQSLPKRTSTTDLIGLIKTTGTNTQRVNIRDIGIDPIQQKPDILPPIIDTRTAFTNTDKIIVQNTGTDSIPEKPKPLMTSIATDPLFYLGQKNKDTNTLAEKGKDFKDIGTDPRPIQNVQQTTIATDPIYYLGQSVKHTNTMPIVTEDKGTVTLPKQDFVSQGTDPRRMETKEKQTSYDGVETVEKANDPIKITAADKGQQYGIVESKPKVKSVYTGTDIYTVSGKITQTSFIEEPRKNPITQDVDTQTTRIKHTIWQKEPEQKPLPPESPSMFKQPRESEINIRPNDSYTTQYITPKTPEEASEDSKEEDDVLTPSELSVHLRFEKCHEEIYRRRGDLCNPRCVSGIENQRKFLVCEKKRSNTIRITNRSDYENTNDVEKKQSSPSVELKLSLRTIRSPNSTRNYKKSNKQNKSSSPERSPRPSLRENCHTFMYKNQPNKHHHISRKDITNGTIYNRRKSSVRVVPIDSSATTSRPTFRRYYWRDIANKVKHDN